MIAATAREHALTEQELFELTQIGTATGGKPTPGEGIVDFFAWMLCGFNHHYEPTGKTKRDVDLVFPIILEQVKCKDCGYVTWRRKD